MCLILHYHISTVIFFILLSAITCNRPFSIKLNGSKHNEFPINFASFHNIFVSVRHKQMWKAKTTKAKNRNLCGYLIHSAVTHERRRHIAATSSGLAKHDVNKFQQIVASWLRPDDQYRASDPLYHRARIICYVTAQHRTNIIRDCRQRVDY